MKNITQDMKFRQSLLNYAQKHGVSKAARKYNKSSSYIYFWKNRYDGTLESLTKKSTRPHSHPKAHTNDEIILIQNMRKRNPNLGMIELWHRLRKRGYKRCPESLYRVMKKMGLFEKKPKIKYISKPYEQMSHPGERIQIDVKVVPKHCRVDSSIKLYQYTAIDEYSRLRYLGAYNEQSTYSSSDFLKRVYAYFKRLGVKIECVQTDNGAEFTNRFTTTRTLPTLFDVTAQNLGIRHKLIKPYTPRHNGKVERSHREDVKRLYSCHTFYSLADFDRQLAAYQSRSNNIPMRPLNWQSPKEYFSSFTLQYV